MSESDRATLPRLSDARALLPLIRTHVEAEAARRPLPVAVDLLPVVDDDLFGYELLPECSLDDFVIVGRDAADAPVVRRTRSGGTSPAALRLAAVNGRPASWRAYVPRARMVRTDERVGAWTVAAATALAALRASVGERPVAATRWHAQVHEAHPGLERALAWAGTRLATVDPRIQFFGLPNEAQMGFSLVGDGDSQGRLALEGAAGWTLRWTAPDGTLADVLPPAASPRPRAPGAPAWERRRNVRRAGDAGAASDPVTMPLTERRLAPGRRTTDRRD